MNNKKLIFISIIFYLAQAVQASPPLSSARSVVKKSTSSSPILRGIVRLLAVVSQVQAFYKPSPRYFLKNNIRSYTHFKDHDCLYQHPDKSSLFAPDMKEKILYGVNPEKYRLIGAHSPNILKNSSYQLKPINSDKNGVIIYKIRKWLMSKNTWSDYKNYHTLFSQKLSDNDILELIEEVSLTPTKGIAKNGNTLHKVKFESTEIVVIKDANGKVISSFPSSGEYRPNNFKFNN